jgi:hypothetical protein
LQTGTKISGVAHLGLISWMVFGGAFTAEPLPFEVQEVSVITVQEFESLVAAGPTPQPVPQPAALPVPDASTDAPDVTSTPDANPEQPTPEPVARPAEDAIPEVRPDQSPPEAEVSDAPPTIAEPVPDVIVETDRPLPRPKPRPVDRVAPTPVAPPPPDARPDEVASPEIAPDTGAEAQRELKEQTAPQEATDTIVTEADPQGDLAPSASPRPRVRPPAAPKPAAAKPAADADSRDAAVAAALAEALGGALEEAPAPTGPPLTAGEKDSLRLAVSQCWNVGSLSTAALATTVVVAVQMSPDAKPVTSSIRMVSFTDGSEASAAQAFEAARRAIIRCGASGFALPAEKYGQWRDIEMTFNPERMRVK